MHRNRKSILKSLLLGVLTAAAVTLIAMLALAAVLLYASIGDGLLRTLNQLIKLLAILLGVCAAVPLGSRRGLATGTAVALIYIVAGYGLYVALGGARFVFTNMLGEMLLSCAAGAVTGSIRANLQGRRRASPAHG